MRFWWHRPGWRYAFHMAQPLASVLTLGCKLNLADSEELARQLRLAGFRVADSLCEADAYVINTCSVTHTADRKSRKLVRSVRRLAPEAKVVVTGCFPQSAGFEVAAALGADFVAGTRDEGIEPSLDVYYRITPSLTGSLTRLWVRVKLAKKVLPLAGL